MCTVGYNKQPTILVSLVMWFLTVGKRDSDTVEEAGDEERDRVGFELELPG